MDLGVRSISIAYPGGGVWICSGVSCPCANFFSIRVISTMPSERFEVQRAGEPFASYNRSMNARVLFFSVLFLSVIGTVWEARAADTTRDMQKKNNAAQGSGRHVRNPWDLNSLHGRYSVLTGVSVDFGSRLPKERELVRMKYKKPVLTPDVRLAKLKAFVYRSEEFRRLSESDKVNFNILLDNILESTLKMWKPEEISSRMIQAYLENVDTHHQLNDLIGDMGTRKTKSQEFDFYLVQRAYLQKVRSTRSRLQRSDTESKVRSLLIRYYEAQLELHYFFGRAAVQKVNANLGLAPTRGIFLDPHWSFWGA